MSFNLPPPSSKHQKSHGHTEQASLKSGNSRAKACALVEADGSTVPGDPEPPAQSSVYIPPGVTFVESYRLSTFEKFPKNVPVQPVDLARAGFYYTGFRDRVKCFSCGLCVENWTLGDDVFDRKWHRTDCLFAKKLDTRNVPDCLSRFTSTMDAAKAKSDERHTNSTFLANIENQKHSNDLEKLDLRTEADRRATFALWPIYPAPQLPSSLADAGFFYLGNLDRVQCFSCSGVLRNWAPGDNARDQHSKRFPDCKFSAGTDVSNVAMDDEQRSQMDAVHRQSVQALLLSSKDSKLPDPSIEEERHLASHLRCETPFSKKMEPLQSRKDSFANWPANQTRVSVDQLSVAGFFYLGESDRTQCFYCNGGLQNWEYDDEPWTEHAKWFPGCEFVLRKKGKDFVSRLCGLHPNLDRPPIRNAINVNAIPSYEERRASDVDQNLPDETTADRKDQSRTLVQHRLQNPDSGLLCENSAYVPPGDKWRESCRLGTFGSKFAGAKGSPPCAKRNAASGFCWTGFRDELKCVGCGAIGQNGQENSHLPDCGAKEDVRNVSLKRSGFEDIMERERKVNRPEISHHDRLVNANRPARNRAWSSYQDEDRIRRRIASGSGPYQDQDAARTFSNSTPRHDED